MRFESKPEAYLYTLYALNELLKKTDAASETANAIQALIETIKISIENHAQNITIISDALRNFTENPAMDLSSEDKEKLNTLSIALAENTYEQSLTKKWENALGRRIESELQIAMLQHPTRMMMTTVKKISDKIISFLSITLSLKCMREKNHGISFGSFPTLPSAQDVILILTENSPHKLAEIMHIHFKFVLTYGRAAQCVGETVAHAITQIADLRMYESTYYRDRGRGSIIHPKISCVMGLLIDEDEQEVCTLGLPHHASQWVSDSKVQKANLESPYVKTLLKYDTPYVAGPSGMTALLTAQMIALGTTLSLPEKQSYIAVIAAYIVSAGFHSLHEVLGPAAYCLPEHCLVPHYHTALPNHEKSPPNYHAFYQNLEKIDSEFHDVRKKGWENITLFFNQQFLSRKNTPLLESRMTLHRWIKTHAEAAPIEMLEKISLCLVLEVSKHHNDNNLVLNINPDNIIIDLTSHPYHIEISKKEPNRQNLQAYFSNTSTHFSIFEIDIHALIKTLIFPLYKPIMYACRDTKNLNNDFIYSVFLKKNHAEMTSLLYEKDFLGFHCVKKILSSDQLAFLLLQAFYKEKTWINLVKTSLDAGAMLVLMSKKQFFSPKNIWADGFNATEEEIMMEKMFIISNRHAIDLNILQALSTEKKLFFFRIYEEAYYPNCSLSNEVLIEKLEGEITYPLARP